MLPIYPKAHVKYLYECTDDKRKDKTDISRNLIPGYAASLVKIAITAYNNNNPQQ